MGDPREQASDNQPKYMNGPTALFYTGVEINEAIRARNAGLDHLISTKCYTSWFNSSLTLVVSNSSPFILSQTDQPAVTALTMSERIGAALKTWKYQFD